jgi:hypothetical protein
MEVLSFLAGRTLTRRGYRFQRVVDYVLYHLAQGLPRAYPDSWYDREHYSAEPPLLAHAASGYRPLFTDTEGSWQGNYTWPSYVRLVPNLGLEPASSGTHL